MKYFMQLIIIGIVFWVSTKLLPGYVTISDTKTLIIAAIAYSVISAFLTVIIVGALLTLILNGQVASAIFIGCFLTTIVSYLSLLATESYIPGFQIASSGARLIIAIITSIATTRLISENSSQS